MTRRIHTPTATAAPRRGAAVAATVLLLAAPVHAARAQADLPARGEALAARVAAVREGQVRLAYPLRAGVCGVGESVRVGRETRIGGSGTMVVSDGNWSGSWYGGGRTRSREVEWERECETGPGRLVLDVSGGVVRAVRFYVGGRWRPADEGVRDLGDVAPDQAAGLLLRVAGSDAATGQGGARGALVVAPDAARSAIFPATLAEGVTPWPTLLRMARDTSRPREIRRQALHWIGVGAGEVATRNLAELADDGDREVRLQALHALSRRPAGEGVSALLAVARTHRDPEMRRSALFWLGRSEDPRAIAYLEELLVARR